MTVQRSCKLLAVSFWLINNDDDNDNDNDDCAAELQAISY